MSEMHEAPPKKKLTWLWILLGVPLQHELFGANEHEQIGGGSGQRLNLGRLAQDAERVRRATESLQRTGSVEHCAQR